MKHFYFSLMAIQYQCTHILTRGSKNVMFFTIPWFICGKCTPEMPLSIRVILPPPPCSNNTVFLPSVCRAAFQYGVKMNAGRKTRRYGKGGEKDEKAKLDREWKQISNVSKSGCVH